MNPEYDLKTYNFPHVEKKNWKNIFPDTDPLLIELLSRVMVYSPESRATAMEVLALPYFDELRDQLTYSHLSSMYHLRDFFRFSKEEAGGQRALMEKLIPSWYWQK